MLALIPDLKLTEPFLSRRRFQQRLGMLRTERDIHLGDWREITEYIRPTRGRYLYSTVEESKKPTRLINNTPALASRTLQAGLLSGASSPAYQWFRLTTDDDDLNKWGPVRQNLERRMLKVYKILAKSNFYDMTQIAYGDAGDFGNAVAVLDADFENVMRANVLSPGEYYFGVDMAGEVDSLYREFTLTAWQMVQLYGKNCSRAVIEAYDKGNRDYRFKVIQAIEPNLERDSSQAGWRGQPFVSVTFEYATSEADSRLKDEEGLGLLEVLGYADWPVANLRWSVDSGNVYASGPGLLALGDARALQILERRKAQGVDKMITPPMQGPPQLKAAGALDHTPGGITYVDPVQGRGAVSPLYEVSAHGIQVAGGETKEHEFRINSAYYKDLFLMLATTDRREITAREVEEKHEEKLIALGPVLQRLHRTYLSTAIVRAYNLADRAGIFPPFPRELQGRQIQIEYTSTLAFAQRAGSAAAMERFLGFAGQLSGVQPQVLGKIDFNAVMDEYAEAVGVPASIIIDSARAQQAQQAAAAQAQAQALPEQAVAGAQAAKLLSETDTSRPSVLQSVLQRSGAL